MRAGNTATFHSDKGFTINAANLEHSQHVNVVGCHPVVNRVSDSHKK